MALAVGSIRIHLGQGHGTVWFMTAPPDPEQVLQAPSGAFELLRHPFRKRSTLRAWDAADAYVLRHLAEVEPEGPVAPVAVVNDGFGALGAGLHQYGPTIVADSAMSEIGVSENLERNGLRALTVSSEISRLPDGLGTVIIKIPKSLGQLEDQLHLLRAKVSKRTMILGAGMVRDIHTSTLELFERILGPTTTSLAKQKARLIHCVFDPELTPPKNPWPMIWRHNGLTIHNAAGVFSAKSLDIGTRLMLENLPLTNAERIVDLGCGNGILGLTAAVRDPEAVVAFVDVSARAITSAKATWTANLGDRNAEFHRTCRLADAVTDTSVDLIVNNPPFHDERAIGDATAWDMFTDSRVALRPGGRLVVVGNRHLGHHTRLKKIFGNCETVASNRKFVVLAATRTN